MLCWSKACNEREVLLCRSLLIYYYTRIVQIALGYCTRLAISRRSWKKTGEDEIKRFVQFVKLGLGIFYKFIISRGYQMLLPNATAIPNSSIINKLLSTK